MAWFGIPRPFWAIIMIVVGIVTAVVGLPLINAGFSLVGTNIASNPTLCPDGSICQNISNGTQMTAASVNGTLRANSTLFTVVWLFAILGILVTGGVLLWQKSRGGWGE